VEENLKLLAKIEKLDSNQSVRQIASALGVSVGTAARLKRAASVSRVLAENR
jgi:hypothetical protein